MSKANMAKAVDENGHVTKSVYLTPDKTMTALVSRLETVAEAGLRMMAGVVVHVLNRTHALVEADVCTPKQLDVEIERAITRHATGKNGKTFEHAWTARLVATGRKIAKAMDDDFTKSGFKGAVEQVLLSKTVDDANDIVYDFMMRLTKGANNLTAIVKVMNPPKVGHGNAGKASNNVAKDANGLPVTPKVRADTAPAASVAARVLGAAGGDIFKAIPTDKKTATATAITLADNIGKGNIDREAFVLRSVALINDPELLVKIADLAMSRAKELTAKSKPAKARSSKAKSSDGDVAMPDAAAASAQVG